MDALSPSTEVRLSLGQCLNTLSTSSDQHDIIGALQTLGSYLDPQLKNSNTPVHQEEFKRSHYTRVLQFLITNIQADWLFNLSAAQQSELWDSLYLKGPPEQALFVLMDGVAQINLSSKLDHLTNIVEKFLQSGRLTDLLWSYCLRTGPPDTPQFREMLIGRIAALPDIMANKFQLDNKPLFFPQNYYPLLARGMLTALERTCQTLKDGTDCSLTFVAQILGKVSIQGHSDLVMAVLVPHASKVTRVDMVWQRVCWKLFENVPPRWTESVLTGLVQAVRGPDALGRIIGNLVVSNKKTQYVMTHKMLLLQHKYETRVLRVVLGYLAADRERRPLLLQALRSICQAWANPSAVRHTPLEQQLYVSKALLISLALLDDSELKELRSELLQCLLGGMQSHLDSSVEQVRRIGMVVGESVSARLNINDTKLTFEYDVDEDTQELLSLSTPTTDDQENDDDEKEVFKVDSSDVDQDKPTVCASQNKPSSPTPNANQDSDLDSDDELTPYDMSCDQKLSQSSPPRYLRDCLEILSSSDDALRVELSLNAAEGLVRRNPFATKEISVQMTKVLLHIEDKYSVENFLALRQAALVALTVTDCAPVTTYLTTEFYSLNYSLRQRLDILEVLALSAQELSKPVRNKTESCITEASSSEPSSRPGGDAADWRQVVEKRIQSKTKRFSKGYQAPPKASPNRYAPVAGHFFFPLLQNYDKPKVTFDLLGSDHLVLGRLIYTLGLFMQLALNAPIAAQMGHALLDFAWTVRYHAEQTVRRGVLFAVCSVCMSMPSQNLLDLGEQLFEIRAFLAEVAEGDADSDCRSLAVQCLVLLDKGLKKQLHGP